MVDKFLQQASVEFLENAERKKNNIKEFYECFQKFAFFRRHLVNIDLSIS